MGTITTGTANRFNSWRSPAGGPTKDDVAQVLMKQPPAQAYSGLQPGPESTVSYEPNLALPIDGSDSMLRALSPFVMRVEPPLVYGNEPGIFGAQNGAPTTPVNVYSNAMLSVASFQNARGTLLNAYFNGSAVGGMLPGGTVSTVSGERTVARSGDGTSQMTQTGQSSGRLGKPAIADARVAVDIANQLRALLNTPPLVLLINPQSLSLGFTKVQQFQSQSRQGFIFHAWGEEQPRLSITGKCGAFISGGRGVQMASRRDSAAWQNLMAAFALYKNNGYLQDTIGKANTPHLVGGLSISYDGWTYYGNMGSFNYGYTETNQQGGVQFEMVFTVSMMMDNSKASSVILPMSAPTASPSDPRYSGMQAPGMEPVPFLSVSSSGALSGLGVASTRMTADFLWLPLAQAVGIRQSPASAPRRSTTGFQAG